MWIEGILAGSLVHSTSNNSSQEQTIEFNRARRDRGRSTISCLAASTSPLSLACYSPSLSLSLWVMCTPLCVCGRRLMQEGYKKTGRCLCWDPRRLHPTPFLARIFLVGTAHAYPIHTPKLTFWRQTDIYPLSSISLSVKWTNSLFWVVVNFTE